MASPVLIMYWNHFVCLSVRPSVRPSFCSSVHVSDHVHSVSPELLNHSKKKKKIVMMVYYHEAMCHAEELFHYLQFQGHSEGLYYQNMFIFTIFF